MLVRLPFLQSLFLNHNLKQNFKRSPLLHKKMELDEVYKMLLLKIERIINLLRTRD